MRRSLRHALRALAAHGLRATLAVTAVTVGVAAVIVTSAIGAGVQQDVMRRIESAGVNLLVVRPAQVKRLVARKTIRGIVTTLTIDDHDAIATLPLVGAVAPGAEGSMTVKAGTSATRTRILGTTTPFLAVQRLRLRAGRFIGAEDDRTAQRVAVLGARVSETLFGDGNPVGQEIRVRGVPFEVIGVLAGKGALADGGDQDDQVLVPVRTALRRLLNVTWLTMIFVSVRESDETGKAASAVAALLRERHAPDDFAVQDTTRSLAMQKQMADALTLLTTGLAAIALLVGGVGILALMLLSVKERTAEIGLRMAVGARPRDILVQFLFEATLLALSGWVTGAMLGGLGAAAAAFGTTWPVAVPREALVASFAMAIVTGLGFGVIPARRAALVPPIDALRLN